MSKLEQENQELREEVITFKDSLERLTSMIETLAAAQNQSSNNSQDLVQQTTISKNVSTLIPVAPVNDQKYHMQPGFPWGMPHGYMPTGYHPQNPEAPVVTVVMFIPPFVVHTTPYNEENIYHDAPSEVMGVDERLDGFQDQFLEIQREINALGGKDLFGNTTSELCLVPNVQILPKFKVPDFEKYKANSCPQSHLVMYARKMSTHTDNHQLLIHYFQDSLTGVALKWYMGLGNLKIHMAPDIDQLRAMSQKDKESFKEYAQRWREIVAQIFPSLEEKDMTKIFLKTLSSFYYDRMIAIAPSDFTEMVNMGMRLEEAVPEGRLNKEFDTSIHVNKFANNFSKKKESDVSVVSYGKQRRKYQHVVAVSLIISTPMVAPIYQPQFSRQHQQQYPKQHVQQQPSNQQHQQPSQQALSQFNNQNRIQKRPQCDPIPMSYDKMFPALLAKNHVQTRSPPPLPKDLAYWYKAYQFCAYHQGAPGHNIENCFGLKSDV
ncbi:uncharacterized protein LOC127137237 [Lathyrus oleraceus]|uniref:uncharacterized protein LOC127137237 n=1 Tax=Pisum sativum TaxID=3888 RepID=UPI0021D3E5A6|nr:uncharacterized protein LOC127137237 [Pisum sativum]